MSDHHLIYESPAMLIGKHTWKIQVCQDDKGIISPSVSGKKDFTIGPTRHTHYLFNAGKFWAPAEHWPTYDSNHAYGGLPKTLSKLFNKYEAQIYQALIVPADGSHTIAAAAPQPLLFTLDSSPVRSKIIVSDKT